MTENLRVVGTNKYGWTYKKVRVRVNNIDDFEVLMNRREIRNGQVNKLRRLLENGAHFDTPLVVNLKGDKFRLIDGNHRYEAIVNFLKKFDQRGVEVAMCVYEDLDEDQEKEIFTRWNSGTKQSFNDFIKQYWDDMPITKWFDQDFPCNVRPKWATNAMEYRVLMIPYCAWRHNVNTRDGQFRGNAMDFIHYAQQLKRDDYNILKEFMKEYIAVFGMPSRKNVFYTNPIFSATISLWLKNHHRFNSADCRKRLKKLIGNDRVTYWAGQGGSRTNIELCMRDLLVVVNSHIKRESKKWVIEIVTEEQLKALRTVDTQDNKVDGQHRLAAIRKMLLGA